MKVHDDIRDRFMSKVVKTSGCWQWIGAKHRERETYYPQFWLNGKIGKGHRIAYELHKGPIPPGLMIDHVCRNTLCVNPDHLEAVTNAVNTLRGFSPQAINARKTTCMRGHMAWARTKDNRRQCVECKKMHDAIRYQKARKMAKKMGVETNSLWK